jgi:hypothetical protein
MTIRIYSRYLQLPSQHKSAFVYGDVNLLGDNTDTLVSYLLLLTAIGLMPGGSVTKIGRTYK